MRVWALVAPLVVAGCVNMTSSSNYVPQNQGTTFSFNACQQLSSTPEGAINYAMVRSCMETRNYRLEEAGWMVATIEVVTFPFWFPVDVLTGGRFSANMAVGDGRSE